ncbi:MAG TPA: hypothetical protein QGF95_23740 [Candidatus Latescibacteria bacterium]|nr:hypothetical protein [Candidatus Latescibacterota bacterium]HJP33575.1 hypothetical protein [Candidatus Latescibacterota bacterium]
MGGIDGMVVDAEPPSESEGFLELGYCQFTFARRAEETSPFEQVADAGYIGGLIKPGFDLVQQRVRLIEPPLEAEGAGDLRP